MSINIAHDQAWLLKDLLWIELGAELIRDGDQIMHMLFAVGQRWRDPVAEA